MNFQSHTHPVLSKPSWIRIRWSRDKTYRQVEKRLDTNGVQSVCREARCPNIMECWCRGTATFLILGDACTRTCRFCAVKKGLPRMPDVKEPVHVARVVHELGLKHTVITSVTRDDLADGGASFFAATLREIQNMVARTTSEVLVPDFQGSEKSITKVLRAGPDVFGHNVETVPRLYMQVRPQADYQRSLSVLSFAKKYHPQVLVKSSIMLGLGEREQEIAQVMYDLREAGCDILTIGQYLSPTANHFPVLRYWKPDEFQTLKEKAFAMGFSWVESGPLVRSSYRAEHALIQRKDNVN